MNTVWLYLMGALAPGIAEALDVHLAGPNLDLFMPKADETAGCPPLRPEGCNCERFIGKDSGKYFQCATDPFCERCAEHWD